MGRKLERSTNWAWTVRGVTHSIFGMSVPHRVAVVVLLALIGGSSIAAVRRASFGPGERVLLDAHNAYPEAGRWSDRIDRALSTGTPLAIEQDLYWHRDSVTGAFDIVVAHDAGATQGAPTLESYFFEKIRPIMERALRENRKSQWPLIVLNLDFKTNERAHHDAVWALLGKYESWLTTAPRTATPDIAAPLTVGPLLVLAGSDSGQRTRFHDLVPIGDRLRAFGGIPVPASTGTTREERAIAQVRSEPSTLISRRAGNYARWVNFPWGVVELGGQPNAGNWSSADSLRLHALVRRAREQELWIRFYTLDGYAPDADRGYTPAYNFGSDSAAAIRWRAAIAARVDFVATDQYERFVQVRSGAR